VEVCPFDALFWSPEFEYATYELDLLTHEKEKLEEWTYTVLPPPELEVGAVAPAPEPAVVAAEVAAPAVAPPAAAPAPVAPAAEAAPSQEAGAAAAAPAAHVEVEADAETYERVLAEQLALGKDRRVAEGTAKRAAMIAARRKAGGA
jgi:hypothetical protein